MTDKEAQRFPAKVSGRLDSIDLLRVVAACGIIWFHMEEVPFRRVGFAGLVFFLVVGVVFQKAAAERDRWRDYSVKRSVRLLIPWAAWFLLYGVLNSLVGKPVLPWASSPLAGLLSGPWIGLWFLPFSFIVSVLVFWVVRALTMLGSIPQFCLWLMVFLGTLAGAVALRSNGDWQAPWAQWIQAAPSVPLGLATACGLGHSSRRVWMMGGLNLCVLTTCALVFPSDPGMALSYGLGSIAVSGGLMSRRPLARWIGPLSACCLGVYLVHGAVMSGARMAFPGLGQHYLVWFGLTVLASFLVSAVTRRIPVVKQIV